MNTTKLLIGIAALSLTALSSRAQSVLEDIILESANATSILHYQGGSDVTMANTLSSHDLTGIHNSGFTQVSTAPDAGQAGQLESTAASSSNEAGSPGLDGIGVSSVAAVPEPSSLLLFGVSGVAAVAFVRRSVAGTERRATVPAPTR